MEKEKQVKVRFYILETHRKLATLKAKERTNNVLSV